MPVFVGFELFFALKGDFRHINRVHILFFVHRFSTKTAFHIFFQVNIDYFLNPGGSLQDNVQKGLKIITHQTS